MSVQLLPYQREDVDKIHALRGVALDALEPGLGKTIEFLSYLMESKNYPAVVVCPLGLKLNWQREAWEKYGVRAKILDSSRPPWPGCSVELRGEKLIILNYDILAKWRNILRRIKPKLIGVDECQLIGNMNTVRSRNVVAFCNGQNEGDYRIPHRIFMSGTPLTNMAWELFPTLNLLWPEEFDSPFDYGMTFCDGDKEYGKWRFRGSKNLLALNARLRELGMIRRTKLEVLPQLPPKRIIIVPMEIEDRKEYREAEADLIAWLAKTDLGAARRAARAERYTKFCYLKRLAAKLKMKYVLDWLDMTLCHTDHKVLTGVIHTNKLPILPMIHSRFEGVSVKIQGGMSPKERQAAEDAFRKDPKVRQLVAQMQAGGVGLNMPEADVCCVVELPFTPGLLQQFINRPDRLTRKGRLDVYILVATGTIEEDLCRIIQRKQGILDRVLDGVTVKEDSLTIYDELQATLLRKGK